MILLTRVKRDDETHQTLDKYMENEEKKSAPSAEELKAEAEKAEAEAKAAETASQEALKKELDKAKGKFSKRERLEFEKKKIDEQLAKVNEEEGYTPPVDDDTPVTVGMLDKLKREQGKKTALELAESVEDETERELAKHYIQNRIVPSGNAEEDLKLARAAINSIKNAQIAEELARKGQPAKGDGSSQPAKHEGVFTPTPEEAVFMQSPYNLSKEDIIEARKKV